MWRVFVHSCCYLRSSSDVLRIILRILLLILWLSTAIFLPCMIFAVDREIYLNLPATEEGLLAHLHSPSCPRWSVPNYNTSDSSQPYSIYRFLFPYTWAFSLVTALSKNCLLTATQNREHSTQNPRHKTTQWQTFRSRKPVLGPKQKT